MSSIISGDMPWGMAEIGAPQSVICGGGRVDEDFDDIEDIEDVEDASTAQPVQRDLEDPQAEIYRISEAFRQEFEQQPASSLGGGVVSPKVDKKNADGSRPSENITKIAGEHFVKQPPRLSSSSVRSRL
ncbi:uncharacterized protein TRIVIDRAFT_111526 [Trichoderma virens Gv29-8]|uniref:Uncharacterized protein n=1 Tax=Hypocrea virens (strain Gv29-8 / FGSC 10586) TaxID=413071 RepID=G9N6L8_HYPVG|nr:uncharacterized protein TRIVIDRAFT_111526 [Trichoderma virens Gv29-8]EHK17778.1 hypothetical protein TRIVIDRAFT_111526 [Trichoderma virens Gv29-8]